MPFRKTPEFRDLKREVNQRSAIVWEQATQLLALRRTDLASRYPQECAALFAQEPTRMLVEWISAVEARMQDEASAQVLGEIIPTLTFDAEPPGIPVYLSVFLRQDPRSSSTQVELFQGGVELRALPTIGSKISFRWPGSNRNIWGEVAQVSQHLDLRGDDLIPWDQLPDPEVSVVVREKGTLPWPSLARAELLERLRVEREQKKRDAG
jgi:hypothetical protein